MVKLLGKECGTVGFGLMGFSWREPEKIVPLEQAIVTLHKSIELGVVNWNAGEFYGTAEYNSLHILNAYFTRYPEDANKIVLCIKGGVPPGTHNLDGSRAGIQRSIDYCLKMLDGKKKIDLYECARTDPKVPIEDTVSYIAEYVRAGKIGGISLSECRAETIRKISAVHPISAVEVEFSLFSTDPLENGVAKTCAELDIPLVAYSPLSRGFLTGEVRSYDDLDDLRRSMPRFQPGAFEANLKLADEVVAIAKKKGCTAGQIALAWVKRQSGRNGMPQIFPIPGTTSGARLAENMAEVSLTPQEEKEIDDFLTRTTVQGDRYGGPAAALMNG